MSQLKSWCLGKLPEGRWVQMTTPCPHRAPPTPADLESLKHFQSVLFTFCSHSYNLKRGRNIPHFIRLSRRYSIGMRVILRADRIKKRKTRALLQGTCTGSCLLDSRSSRLILHQVIQGPTVLCSVGQHGERAVPKLEAWLQDLSRRVKEEQSTF